MAGYNRTRYVEQLLEKTESSPPSFTVHLHPEYWVLNNGSKFLYHNQIASLLDDIRAQRIPVDFLELFDSAQVPFYDGCMVVELLDYRPQRSKEPALKIAEKTRVVLHPNSETLWADICLMNRQNGAQWTDRDALEVEAKILLATSQPLCLDPDPHLTRIVNSVLRMSTPTMPPSLKRKAAAMEPEEDGPEKARRSRILSFMAPQNNKSHMSSYRILEALSAFRLKSGEAGPGHASMAGHQYMNGVPQSAPQPQPHSQPTTSTPTPVPATLQGASPMDVDKTSRKADATPLAVFNVPLARQNGSNTPLPPQLTHRFVNQQSLPNHPIPNGMQPQVYSSVQAATDAATKPAATAQMQQQMQQHYIQHQYHQHQQQQQQQQQQSHPPNQPQPPSQPQHPQQPQQRFTQSPKPPAQPNATTPAPAQSTPQSFPGVQPAFQPPISHSHFLQQPPSGGRNGPGPQPTNQQQHQQTLYSQPQQQPQLSQQQIQSAIQQRMAMAVNAQRNGAGGRATPQAVPVQVSAQQLQHPGQAATPSPVKNSPSFTHQQLAAAQAARSSPMPAKAQPQVQPQHPLLAQQMQMQMPPHPNRIAFTPQYNSSQPRPMVHGNSQPSHMGTPNQGVVTNSPTTQVQTMSASPQASSSSVSGRPMTPTAAMVSGDGKQQQSGQVQGQMQGLLQQPLRRQTPQQQLQGQLAVARAASQSQSPHTPQAQIQQQTPQLQQRTPQQQFQQVQNQQSSPQTQAQAQPQPQPQTQPQIQPQQQQMPAHPHYAQMYGYSQMNYPGAFWPRGMQGMIPTSAATPQQQLLIQQAQQQAQHSQQQQPQPPAQQQQLGVVGGQPTIVNSQQLQQQSQGSMPIMANSQQAYEHKVKLAAQHQQAAMMNMATGKMPVQPGQGGKGKAGQKKTASKRGGGAGR